MKYDLGLATRVGMSTVLDAKPYLLIYDKVPDDDEVHGPDHALGDGEQLRLVQNYYSSFFIRTN